MRRTRLIAIAGVATVCSAGVAPGSPGARRTSPPRLARRFRWNWDSGRGVCLRSLVRVGGAGRGRRRWHGVDQSTAWRRRSSRHGQWRSALPSSSTSSTWPICRLRRRSAHGFASRRSPVQARLAPLFNGASLGTRLGLNPPQQPLRCQCERRHHRRQQQHADTDSKSSPRRHVECVVDPGCELVA
jgi:hypothetical protein